MIYRFLRARYVGLFVMLALFVCLLIPSDVSAATPAFVQKATANVIVTPNSVSPTWAAPTTAGNLLVAIFSCRSPGQGATASAVVPPAGLGWTSVTSASTNYGNGGGRAYIQMFYIANAASQSGAQAWTWTGCAFMGSNNGTVSMLEYSGVDTVSPLDNSASDASPNDAAAFAYTADTTANSGTTATTAQAKEFVIAAMATLSQAMGDPSNSFTERLDGGTITGGHYLSVSDKTLSATGTPSTAATYGSAQISVGVIGTFKYTTGNSISGTLYSDEGTTALGSKTVAVSVNGAAAAGTATTNASTGAYTISNITMSANDVLTLYVDGATEDAVTVTKATGGDITGINLYQNDLITRCDNSCSLTNSNLDTADNNADNDITNIYSVSGGALTVAAGKSLYIPSSHTFAPGGDVSVGGNFTNNGTYTRASTGLTLTGTSTQTLKTNGSEVYALTINGSGGTYTLQDALVMANGLTITAGTLDASASNCSGGSCSITVNASWSNSGTFTARTGTVTATDGAGASTLLINSGGSPFYNLTVNGGGNIKITSALTVSNNLTISSAELNTSDVDSFAISVGGNWTNSGGTFTPYTNTVTLTSTSGSATLTSNGQSFYNLIQNGSGGTYTLQDALSVSNNLTITAGTLDTKSGSNFGVTVGGNWNNGGTFTARSGTVTLTSTSGSATLTPGSSSFYNLTQNGSGGTYTLQGALTTSNNLTITAGTLDTKSGSNFGVTVGGTWSRSGTFTVRSATLTLTGTSTFSDTMSFYNVTVNGSGNTVTLGAALTTTNNLTITAGTLDVSATGCSSASCAISNGANFSNAGTFTARTGTVTLTSTSAGATLTSGGTSFYNLVQNGSGGTYTLQDALSVSNNLTITAGTLDTKSGSNFGITVTGNFSNSGTFTARTGTVTFNKGSSTQTLKSGGSTFSSITHSGAGTLQLVTNALTMTGTLTNSAGTFDLNGINLTATGATINNTATIQLQGGETLTDFTNDNDSGTVLYVGTSTYTVLAAGNLYYHLTFNGTGGSWTLAADLTVNGNLTITAGTLDTKNASNFAIAVGGNWSNAGTFTARAGTVTLTSTSGSATITSGGSAFYNLIQNGSGGTYTLQDAFATTNNLTITAGTLDVSAANCSAASCGVTVGGTWSNSGTFTPRTGTVTLTGTSTFSDTTSFYNLTVNGSGKTVTLGAALTTSNNLTITAGTLDVSAAGCTGASCGITVTGNFSNAGTFTARTGTVTFNKSSSSQTLNPGSSSLYNVTHNAAGTLQLVTNALTSTGAFTNSAGTYDANALTTTVTGLTTVSGGTYTASTDTQTFNGGVTINGGTLTGSSGAITTTDVTLSSGTLTAPSGTFSVSGNWARSGGTFTPGTNTVTFTKSSSTQTLNSGGSSFYNVTHSGAGTLQLTTSALTATAAFTNSAGTYDANGLATTVTGLTTVSGGTYSASTATQTFDGGVTINGGILTGSSGAITTTDVTLSSGTLTAPSGTFSVSGNWAKSGGTFTPGTNTVTFTKSSSTQTLNSGGTSFYNITHSGAGTVQLVTSTLTITHTLTNSAGTFDLSGVNLTTSGATIDNTATIQMQGGETLTGFTNDVNSGTIAYNGSSTYTGLIAGTSYYSLSFTGSGTWKQSATTTVDGNLTIASGTFDLNANALTLASDSVFSNNGTLALVSTETITNLTNDTDSGTILYYGTGSYTGLTLGNTYHSLTFNGSGGAWALTGALTVNGNLTITTGTMNHNGYDLTVKGNVSNSGTISNSSGRTYTLSGTSSQAFNPGAISVANLTISGGSGTVTAGSNFTVLATLNIGSNKTFNLSSYTITAQDTITNAATITPSTGSLVHASSGFEIADSNFDTNPVISIGSESVYLTLTDSNRNLDGTTPDTFSLTITCPNDSESVLLTETGNATGVFRTTGLPSALYSGSATNDNGTLSCANGDSVSTSYADAYDNTDTDSASAVATTDTVPVAPSGFSGSVDSDTSITWSWSDNANNETGFKLYSGAGSLIATIATSNTTSYTETGLSAGTGYTRKVVAYNLAGNSSFSNSDTKTTTISISLPAAPSSLSGVAASSTSITWSWTDNSSNETGFKLYSSTDTLIATISTANSTSYTETGLTKATSYSRYVVAYNGDGNSSASNTASATTSSTTVNTPVLTSPASRAVLDTPLPSFSWTVGQGGGDGLVSYILTIDSTSYTIPATSALASNPISHRHVDDLFVAEYSRENDGNPDNDSVTVTLKGSAALDDGEHGWSVTAKNDSGETKSTGTRGFTIDASAPTVTKLLVDGKALGTATEVRLQNVAPVITVAATDGEGLSQLLVTIERARVVLGVVSGYTAIESKTYVLTGTSDEQVVSARDHLVAGERYRVTFTVTDVAGHATRKSFALIVLSPQAVAQQAIQDLNVATTSTEKLVETLREVLPESPISIPDLKAQAVLRRSEQAENYNQFLLALRRILSPFVGGEAAMERLVAATLDRFLSLQHTVVASLTNWVTIARTQVAEAIRGRAIAFGRPLQASVAFTSSVGDVFSSVRQSTGGVLAAGQDVRIRQGVANRQLINRTLQSVLRPAQDATARVALASRQWYETVFDTAEPTHITNVQVTQLTPTSAVVEWQTNHLSRLTKVNYGPTTSYGQEVISHELTDHHRIELPNLQAGTTYYFEVMNQGRDYVYDAYYTLTTPEEGADREEGVLAPADVIIDTDEPISIYGGASVTSEVIGTAKPNERFRALQEKGEWISILMSSGAEGWVHQKDVRVVSSD